MRRRSPTGPWVCLGLAGLCFSLLFACPFLNFWIQLTASVLILCTAAWWFQPTITAPFLAGQMRGPWGRRFTLGLLSAGLLYFVFFVGNHLAAIVFPGGPSEIAAVYRWRTGTPPWIMGLLLTGIIAPGEELFWRGYVQEQLQRRYGLRGVVLGVLAYGGVHLASGNTMLIIAAFVCGAFWAALYARYRCIWANMISHAVWGVTVFVLFPFGGHA
ncbi:MAG: CPBP family intramembrane metalloprotease [Lentisphaerae bacterium]|nr:CPBP family intramembrane metalloprotease [Lentisphaerota bacterium]MBT4818140.1 CPBP family intramembrane metalloprotease [Lentisphaerota bacterium]MBT5606360.1 CPBP family intramembrane metalloprotease [Lentisphaerota bacterium]MBT7056785.1 CPBP family intramembrane metalloprotease [Lentisphaerota bacterium]MBT7840390.1 CPBP family intramembrane metalloprotease [Lentisphaerota bacterium]